jgi:1,4-alpha-glucan branching enzyme
MDQAYLFNNGLDYMSYNLLGSFPEPDLEGQSGYRFAVWAPHARAVAIVGTFNDWDQEAQPMSRLGTTGIWTGFVPVPSPAITTNMPLQLPMAIPF